jgi:hypothetical protein
MSSEWKPIGEAPTDGSTFLTFNYGHCCMDVAWWDSQETRWACNAYPEGPCATWEPDLWRPLPDPPKDSDGEAKR